MNSLLTTLDHPRKLWLRKALFQIHLWSGLLAGLILIIVGFTGSLLVFYEELTEYTNHHIMIVQPPPNGTKVPIETIERSVKEAYPSYRLLNLRIPTAANQAYEARMLVRGKSAFWAYIDPYTGQVIGDRDGDSSWLWWIFMLHINLQLGNNGLIFNGIAALLLCMLSLSGIIIWWPGRSQIKDGFIIKWRANWKRLNWDLHKVTGIFMMLMLLGLGATGAYFSFPEPLAKLVYAITLSAKPLEAPVSEITDKAADLSLNSMVKAADEALPQDQIDYIYFPMTPEAAYVVSKKPTHGFGNSQIYLDQYSGKMLRVDDVRQISWGRWLLNLAVPIHFGTFGGLLTRIIWVIVGLALPMLFVTGFLMWWNRVIRKKFGDFNRRKVVTIPAPTR